MTTILQKLLNIGGRRQKSFKYLSGKNRIALRVEPLESRQLLSAQPLSVDSFADVVDPYDNVLTFREAVQQADPGDTIVFDKNVFSRTNHEIHLGSAILIDKFLTIDGTLSDGGRISLIADASENNPFRVINISININTSIDSNSNDFFNNVTLTGLNIEGGYLNNGGGAGINVSGFCIQLDLNNCSIANNFTGSGSGGGLSYTGAIVSGSVSANKVTFINNGATSASACYVSDAGPSVAATLTSCVIAGNVSGSGSVVDIACSASSSITDCTIAGNVIQSNATSYLNFSHLSGDADPKLVKNIVVSDNKCEGGSIPQSLTFGTGTSVNNSLFDSCAQLKEDPDGNEQVGTNYLNPTMDTFAIDLFQKEDNEYLFKKWTESEWLDKLQLAGNSIAVNTGNSALVNDAKGNTRKQGGSFTVTDWKADMGALEFAGTAPSIVVQTQERFICEEYLPEGTEIGTISISDIDNLDNLNVSLPVTDDFTFTETATNSFVWTVKTKKELPVQDAPYSFTVTATDTYGKTSSSTVSVIVEQKLDFELNLETSVSIREKSASESDKKTVRENVPNNSVITEWSQYYAEVWAKFTSQNLGNSGNCRVSFSCKIASGANAAEENIFVPESFLAGNSNFSDFKVEGMEQGGNNTLIITCSGTISDSLLNQQILLGKILFTSAPSEGAITNKGGAYTNEKITTALSEFALKAAEGDGSFQNINSSNINKGQALVSNGMPARCAIFDSDDSGEVNMTDFINFAQHFNQNSESDKWLTSGILFDYNDDNKVDMSDFIAFAQNFNSSGANHSIITYPTSLPVESESEPVPDPVAASVAFQERTVCFVVEASPAVTSSVLAPSPSYSCPVLIARDQYFGSDIDISSDSNNKWDAQQEASLEEYLDSISYPVAPLSESKPLYSTETELVQDLTNTNFLKDNNDNSALNGDLDKFSEIFPQNGQIRLAFPGRI